MSHKYIVIIVCTGFVVFFNSLFNGFVWDDGFQLVNNVYVQKGQFFYYFTHTIGPYYKPLMFFLYTVFFQLFNLNAFFYHTFQVTLHITNAILVFLLFRSYSKNIFLSFIFALLFLIHPINEEAAVYIATYQDVLFTFFGLSALILFHKQIFNKYSDYFASFLLFLSMLSKETGILFVIIAIFSICLFRKDNRSRTVILTVTSFLLYFLTKYMLTGFIVPTHFANAIPIGTITAASLEERLITIPKIIFYYLTTFLYPNDLGVQFWYVSEVTLSNFILPLFLDLIFLSFFILVGLNLSKNKKASTKYFWFFFLWFCIGLSLHLQIIPLDFTATTRWFYFPMIGLLGMILIAIKENPLKIDGVLLKKNVILFLVGLVLISLAIRTMVRNTHWYNDLTLFKHELPARENVADIQYLYGSALSQDGKYAESSMHLQKAAALSPNSFLVWHNLGIAYLHLGKLDKAKDCFRKEITIKKDLIEPYRVLIYIALIQNNSDEAKKLARSALHTWPEDPFLWRMLGLAAYQLKDKALAKAAFEKSFSLAPDDITQYYETQLENNLPIEIKEI